MNYIFEAINDFRKENGAFPVVWESWMTSNALEHSRAMAYNHGIYHADGVWLNNCLEAVCCSYIFLDARNMFRYMVYSLLGQSNNHRWILLNCSRMGAGDYVADNQIFLTVRGL